MTSHDPIQIKEPSPPRALFERASNRLDPAMANRLRLARRNALTPAPRLRAAWLPAGAAAAAALAIGLAWWLPEPTATTPDIAQVTANAPLDWVASEEDADLAAWLGDAPVAIEGALRDPKDGAL